LVEKHHPKRQDEGEFQQAEQRACELVDQAKGHQVEHLFQQFGEEVDRHHHQQKSQREGSHVKGIDGPCHVRRKLLRHHVREV